MSLKEFKVLQELGQGSYSRVFKVIRHKGEKEYAMKKVQLKSMPESDQTNALNQVRILASIESPYVIEFKQAFLEESCLFIVMEYAPGGDLKAKIRSCKARRERISEEEVWRFLFQVASGLKSLHDCKVIHCDLKSANVFLSDGNFKLADMNVSKVTKNGLIYKQTGTPYYASPEVWRDEPYDHRSDIWSLGVILYEMTALRLPFLGNSVEQLFSAVQLGQYSPIPQGYSAELVEVIASCMDVDPFKRPISERLISHPKCQQHLLLGKCILEVEETAQLLDTIKANDFSTLKQKLPKPKYEKKMNHKKIEQELEEEFFLEREEQIETNHFPKSKNQRQRVDYVRNFAKNNNNTQRKMLNSQQGADISIRSRNLNENSRSIAKGKGSPISIMKHNPSVLVMGGNRGEVGDYRILASGVGGDRITGRRGLSPSPISGRIMVVSPSRPQILMVHESAVNTTQKKRLTSREQRYDHEEKDRTILRSKQRRSPTPIQHRRMVQYHKQNFMRGGVGY